MLIAKGQLDENIRGILVTGTPITVTDLHELCVYGTTRR